MAKKLIIILICIAILMMFVAFTGCTSSAPVNNNVPPTTSPIYYNLLNGTVTTINPYPVPAIVETTAVIASTT